MGYGGSWGIFSKFFSQNIRTSLSITRPRSFSPHPAIAARRLRCQRVCAVTTMLIRLRFLFFTATAPPFGLSDLFLIALIRRAVSRIAGVVAFRTIMGFASDICVLCKSHAVGKKIFCNLAKRFLPRLNDNVKQANQLFSVGHNSRTFYFFFRRIWALLCGLSRSRRTMTSSSTSC